MKKMIITFLCGSIAITGFQSTYAQDDTFKELPSITVSANTNVNARVEKAFTRTFPGSSNLRWYQVDKNFLVKFIKDDQENKAVFSKSGSLVYHIKYGNEKNLPDDVRKLIKSTYFDQSITRVLQITQDRRNIWSVSMEDPKDYIWVKVEDMELEETERYQKANN